jgi:hypothetical protein
MSTGVFKWMSEVDGFKRSGTDTFAGLVSGSVHASDFETAVDKVGEKLAPR